MQFRFEKDYINGKGRVKNCARTADPVWYWAVDPSYESIMMANSVDAFAKEANLPVTVVLNRVIPEVDEDLGEALKNLTIIGRIPDRRSIFVNNFKGNPLDTDMREIEFVCRAFAEMWR